MKFLNRTCNFLLTLIMLLFVSGGFMLRTQDAQIELSQVDIFAVLLLICALILWFRYPTEEQKNLSPFFARVQRLLAWGMNPSKVVVYCKIAFVFFFGAVFLGHLAKFATFETHAYDMNFQHQPLFFPFFEGTFLHCNICRTGTMLGEHMAWSFAPLALLAAPFKSDVLLFLLQSLITAFSTWIFLTKGPLRDKKETWFWFFILFTFFSPLKYGLMWDIREDTIGYAGLLLSFTAFWNGQVLWGIFAALAAMWCKENFPAVTFLMGLVILFDRELPLSPKQRKFVGGAIAVFSVVTLAIFFKVLIPSYTGAIESKNNILVRFPGMGNTMSEFILHVLTHPWHFLTTFGGQLLSGKAVRYVLMMLLPVIVFGRKHWLWLIPGLAMAFLNVMTNNLGQKSGGAHYEFIVLPFLLIAVSLGVARWSRETSRSNWTWMWALLLPLCLAGRGPLFETTDRLAQRGYLVPVAIAVSQWQIPQGTLAADERILPHFNRHPQLRLFHSPEIPLPSSPRESATEILQKNPTRPEHHRGHDFHDATLFALRQNEEWQVFLSNEIKRLGGRVIAEAPMPNGKPFLTLLQLDQPLPQKWCENDYFGFVKGNNCAER